MKKFYLLCLIIIIINILGFKFFVFDINQLQKPQKYNVKINDCYTYQFKGQNPFKIYRIDTIKILDIKLPGGHDG